MSSSSQYLVTETLRKIHLLKALVESRPLLTIILPGFKEPATSAILDVDENHIMLDELIPHSANIAIQPGDPFTVMTKLKGIPIRFESLIHSLDESTDGITFYTCRLPETLSYHQKRKNYRLTSYGGTRPSIIISSAHEAQTDPAKGQLTGGKEEDSDDGELSGKITDISMGGVNVEMQELPEWALQDASVTCTIELNEGPRLHSHARICHVRSQVRGPKGKAAHHVGLEFLSLNEINRKQLQQWIFHSERKQLRH